MLVYKQWIYSPNKKGTAKAIVGMVKYISTRDGVEFNEEEKQQQEEKYVDYIATRKGVARDYTEHGLFGKYANMPKQGNINNLGLASDYISKLAKEKTTIYNGIVSLKEEDAVYLGYHKREKWEKLIQDNMYKISRDMNIPPRNLEYFASVHMEKGHPHLHLIYWDKAQKIGRDFIKPELSNGIRKKLTSYVYKNELDEIIKSKDESYSYITEKVKSDEFVLKTSSNILKNMKLKDIYRLTNEKSTRLIDKKLGSKFNNINSDLIKLYKNIKKEYPRGGLKYAYIPINLKKDLDRITKMLIDSNQDIKNEYSKYLHRVKAQSEIFGGKDNINEYVLKADEKIYKYIGNQILNNIKDIKTLEKKYIISKARIQRIMNSIFSFIESKNNNINLGNNMSNSELSETAKKEMAIKLKDKRR